MRSRLHHFLKISLARRNSIQGLIIAVGFLLSGAACLRAETQPNIIVILADDMGFSDIGCYGSEIATPHLDRLAKGGLRFSQFYNTGRCCPSRASLLTGLYPHQAGVGHMLDDTGFPGYSKGLRRDCLTIPQVLKTAGYRTYMCGKWHLGWDDGDSPRARGFDRFYGARGYIDSYFTVVPQTDVYLDDTIVNPAGRKPVNHLHPEREFYTTETFTDYALHFLAGHQTDSPEQPFFLYLAYNAPHWPLQAKDADLAKYRGKYKTGDWNDARKKRLGRLVEEGILPEGTGLSSQDAPAWDSFSDAVKDELDLKMALYAAMIDCMDQNIGRLLAALERDKLLDETLIVFLSDNGGNNEGGLFGYGGHNVNASNYAQWGRQGKRSSSIGTGWANVANTPFRRYKRYNHEGGVSTPLIVHWPAGGVKTGITHQVGHLIDLLPTFAEVAGAPYPAKFDGRTIQPPEGQSLLPVFKGGELGERTIFWEHEGNRAIRAGDWKLVAQHNTAWELYDLASDRSELSDLSGKEPERAAEMKSQWEAWAQRASVLPWPVKPKTAPANGGKKP